MKIFKICRSIPIVLFAALVFSSESDAQDAGRSIQSPVLMESPENIYIQTDRDIYISGETVWLKIYITNGSIGKPLDISKIIYFELLDKSGNPVNQIKFGVDGTSGPAAFRLADTLSTGSYMIRAYTRWMLNQPERNFFHKALSIINPYKNIEQLGAAIVPDSDFTVKYLTVPERSLINNAEGRNGFKIVAIPDRDVYGLRTPVNINISATDESGKYISADLSVTVVKKFLIDSSNVIFEDTTTTDNSSGYMFNKGEKLPEMEGELLRGIIRNKTTNEPLKNTGISLSLVGKVARCQFTKTDENGEFLFVMKRNFGLNEVVVQPVIRDDNEFYVEIYQSFENIVSRLHPGTIRPDSSLIEDINKAIISKQVNSTYDQFMNNTGMHSDTLEMTSFYGKPYRTVRLADFIDLTNIREVVKELLPEVEAIRKNKEFSLRVVSSNRFEQFENQPLVLVDGVPVFDIEHLLNAPSKDFERIDIFNTRYFISDFVFEGLVSFYTRKGDLSILSTDYSGYRQVLEGCAAPLGFYCPDYSTDKLKASRIADFRNTLYWNPAVITSGNGDTSVRFFTSDEKGDYLIVIEGIMSDGRRNTLTIPLEVK